MKRHNCWLWTPSSSKKTNIRWFSKFQRIECKCKPLNKRYHFSYIAPYVSLEYIWPTVNQLSSEIRLQCWRKSRNDVWSHTWCLSISIQTFNNETISLETCVAAPLWPLMMSTVDSAERAHIWLYDESRNMFIIKFAYTLWLTSPQMHLTGRIY